MAADVVVLVELVVRNKSSCLMTPVFSTKQEAELEVERQQGKVKRRGRG